ncbi:MAG: hypothetical protein FJY81_04550 [Candidatus Aminicenantes bacterium]|nr:hypothetical protein [Candidatus Aminicenantes bacterium]
MEKHVQFIGILWIIYGGLGVLFACGVFLFFVGISFIPDLGSIAPGILRLVALAAGFLFMVFSLPSLIAGIGVLKKREWGRVLTLVVSFFNLLNFPLGTALSVYSFVILLNGETARLFRPSP